VVVSGRTRAGLISAAARACLAAAAVGFLVGIVFTPRASAAPEEFGTYPVHVRQVSVPVPIDPRSPEGLLTSVGADVYVPAAPGPWPLVQISHAWPGTLREFPLSGWAQRLASRGMVVIVSDRRGGSGSPAPILDQPADLVDLGTEVNSEDILRVLRWALVRSHQRGSFLYGAIDPSRIALAGHSLGAYYATFAAVKAQTEGPAISALVLLDPSDERLGRYTLESSLAAAPLIHIPTVVLASEENQHPIMCNMDLGTDCTLVAPQEYRALTGTPRLYGLRVAGSVHEDVEDPSTIGTAASVAHLRLFERYGMAWLEYWLQQDCTAAGYLDGPGALQDQALGKIEIFPGGLQQPSCTS
jgi:dienelactone hydrolase